MSAPAGITSFQKIPTKTSNPIISKTVNIFFAPYIYIIAETEYKSTGFFAFLGIKKLYKNNNLAHLKCCFLATKSPYKSTTYKG